MNTSTAVSIAVIQAAIAPYVLYFAALYASGFLTSALTEALKLKQVFVPAEKYPRITAAIISLVTTLVAIYMTPVDLVFGGFFSVLFFFIGVLVISALTYKRIFKGLPTNTQ